MPVSRAAALRRVAGPWMAARASPRVTTKDRTPAARNRATLCLANDGGSAGQGSANTVDRDPPSGPGAGGARGHGSAHGRGTATGTGMDARAPRSVAQGDRCRGAAPIQLQRGHRNGDRHHETPPCTIGRAEALAEGRGRAKLDLPAAPLPKSNPWRSTRTTARVRGPRIGF